jgi:uncharacterized Zn ribbon protein
MTRKEFEEANAERKDALGHTIKVGDLVAFYWWDKIVTLGKVIKICPQVIKIEPVNMPKCIEQRYPDRVIKLKSDAIPED